MAVRSGITLPAAYTGSRSGPPPRRIVHRLQPPIPLENESVSAPAGGFSPLTISQNWAANLLDILHSFQVSLKNSSCLACVSSLTAAVRCLRRLLLKPQRWVERRRLPFVADVSSASRRLPVRWCKPSVSISALSTAF